MSKHAPKNDRALSKPNEHWDCPACAPLSDSQKAEIINFSEGCEMIFVEWLPKREAAGLLQIHTDVYTPMSKPLRRKGWNTQ
eukprot:803468-Pelagomonas_calceolata.AAC.1